MMNHKKNSKIKALITAICLLSAGFMVNGCADANGLHNQMAATVTFIFTNFGEGISGDYTIPGNFNDWNNKVSLINMKDGEGTSNPIVISKSNIEFTLIKTNDSGWLRLWYPAVKGNGVDRGTAGNPYQNFYIDGLDLGAGEITLVIDGSDLAATPVVQ